MKIYKLSNSKEEFFFINHEFAKIIEKNMPPFQGFALKEVNVINLPQPKIETEMYIQVKNFLYDYVVGGDSTELYQIKWEKDLDDLFVLIEDEKIKEARQLFNELNEKFINEDLLKAETMLHVLED